MSRVSLVISSFDGYSDCWLPVSHGIRKYWPDCPYPVFLMTNFKDFEYPGVQVMKMGQDTGWSGRLQQLLPRLSTEYVLYFQEDYWLMAPVDTARVEQYVDLMDRHGLNYIRFVANPEPDLPFVHDERLGLIGPTADYRTSVQITLWRRSVFLDLLRTEENVWQFEINGSVRSRALGDTFLCVKKKGRDEFYWGMYYLCTAINSGRWFRAAKTYAQNEGLNVDFSRLPMETWWDDFKRSGRLGAFAKRWSHRLGLLYREPRAALKKLARRSTK